MIKKIFVSAASAALILGAAGPTLATGPGLNNCWGTVVSQRASYYHDIGEHSSSQEEPRVGVGNLAHDVFNMSVGELASLLGTLDDSFGQDPAGVTNCP
ncbi:hypothetical protein A3D77_04145 [Candidatus Gottesmanbacteria bacterium RIFCSPHIGHO2_02_FULL_39_11]|uniref:Uncharacterized protein n=1 Tax=Candidatus Gottesmanbacteria bacterium RIFCSPHIGHO2_02_FULL_39_11 TaxID=1798382 RepID=A0A1F5ZJM4_9BACT|nr:MAG: hypothetical protein A3D77_04145 [Candidatus Gottesmanbacteria bacterium RIFCSPHIGHO2_02_FULL_39_11]